MNNQILIVDDEADIINLLTDYFELNGYKVLTARSGGEALRKVMYQPDIILLDINMPEIDGLEVCTRIRNFVSCPIIFLTAQVEETDKINGFRVGGDDYIVKPFSIDELGARVEAHLRRERRQAIKTQTRFSDHLVIDYSARVVYYKGRELSFAKKEFGIIELLSMNIGQVFDKDHIYGKVWGLDHEGDSIVVAEHIRRIRSKFNEVSDHIYISTVWGVGYKWIG
ncbi:MULTISPECIES: response regulator transcription factor [unclassified Paenibacillus]|uniref:response regulator transcription factor n=1 Tax=unclassified Paenibacillus TaxID=185978 RepID=UPI0003E27814|nr:MULTISPECIES: response regulator transcription factor [unclassified Paenibacillus]ETT38157.1 winged helix family two component transcriptional regulator [Paenibacillus sp. FSL R7-269]OMF88308.1 DNA-binding response regulator [Paenibacillus sp. FSL R7-0337]